MKTDAIAHKLLYLRTLTIGGARHRSVLAILSSAKVGEPASDISSLLFLRSAYTAIKPENAGSNILGVGATRPVLQQNRCTGWRYHPSGRSRS